MATEDRLVILVRPGSLVTVVPIFARQDCSQNPIKADPDVRK